MINNKRRNNKRQPKVVVIGAGMTGVLAAIKLKQAGIEQVTVLEKASKLGGTWRENRYPGVACDIPAHMYTYSFEPNPNWREFFASGSEIQSYFEHVADKYQVRSTIRFNQAVTEAKYEQGKWHITTSTGERYNADFIINATGILHQVAKPAIPGIDRFKGAMFHTAQWDDAVTMGQGQRVAVIGTGSTAAQVIPELIKTGAQVSVFQRTPQWLLPLANFRFPRWLRASAKRYSWCQKMLRGIPFLFMEHIFTKSVIGRRGPRALLSFLCNVNLRLSIKDKTLRQKLTPDYQVGCKRIIVNKTFYQGIQKPNAHLITDSIEAVTENGILCADGRHHEFDTIVLATGFNPTAYMRPMNLVGDNGKHIDEAWQDGIKAYRSVLLPDFPNFFLMLGPYTPIGNFSVIAMSEVQLGYVLQLIEKWQLGEYDAIAPTEKAVSQFKAHVRSGLSNTAWVAGCQSWYLDQAGEPILWPYTWQQWTTEMANPDWSSFHYSQF